MSCFISIITMKPAMKALFLCLLIRCFVSSSSASHTCSTYKFSNNAATYQSCNDLNVLQSFLHWNFDHNTNRVDIAYRHTGFTTSNWVSWAINPTRTGMIGSQALVAYQDTNNGTMRVYPTTIDGYGTSLQEGSLSFGISNVSASYSNGEIIIFASLQLSSNINISSVNTVWQDGPLMDGVPGIHSMSRNHLMSRGIVDFLSGQTTITISKSEAIPRQKSKNIHGILNVVSWGILMPIGVMIARYLKVFESAGPTWFYLHVGCQTSGYFIGIAGWVTGIILGRKSSGIQHNAHRNIGITLFVLATLQVFAMRLRPNKDHKYRQFWNMYHRTIGYIVIILSIINIFKGLEILDPEKKWRTIYIGFLVVLGCIAIVLEAFSWYVFVKKRSDNSNKLPLTSDGSANETTKTEQV